MHKFFAIGRLGRDPEMRYTPEGTAVANFSLASDEGYGDNKKTLWTRITVWGNLADTCDKYLKKGSRVWVYGSIQPDESGNPRVFQRGDGSWGSSFEVTAREVVFLDTRADSTEKSEPEVPRPAIPF